MYPYCRYEWALESENSSPMLSKVHGYVISKWASLDIETKDYLTSLGKAPKEAFLGEVLLRSSINFQTDESSDQLKDGDATTAVKSFNEEPNFEEKKLLKLLDGAQNMRYNPDVRILVGDGSVNCHRAILSLFTSRLDKEVKKDADEVLNQLDASSQFSKVRKILDFSKRVFYFYSDSLGMCIAFNSLFANHDVYFFDGKV